LPAIRAIIPRITTYGTRASSKGYVERFTGMKDLQAKIAANFAVERIEKR
jgi:hypothetical protein